MADRAITALTAATQMYDDDLFAISQSGTAKKVTWEVFYTYLAEALDGHGGINNISYTAPSSGSLSGTLTITLADATEESFTITNGKGISSVAKTGTSGLVDTYTITYNDTSTSTFTVTNGRAISSVTKTAHVSPSLTDTYTINFNDSSTPVTFTVDNGRGIASSSKSTSGLVDTYTFTYNDATTSTITVTNGKEVSSITDYWGVSTSNSSEPSSYSTTMPTMTSTNKYLWHYQTFTYNDNSSDSTDHAVIGVYGDTGDNWYVWFKWSDDQPLSDLDLLDSPSNWIGVYSGTASTAPTDYTDYEWFQYKGATGTAGVSISGIYYDSSAGLVDTYEIFLTDGTSTSFDVTNGSSIQSISKTGTSGLVDTYTITLTNGNTNTFTVTNAKSITSLEMISGTHAAGTTDTYRITYNTGDTFDFSVYNGANGTGAVSSVAGIGVSGDQGDVPLILSGSGAPTTSTVGQVNQFYFDTTNGTLYICTGETSGSYSWSGTSVNVDSALSSVSTNPVQNAIITAKVGTASLDTTATDLSGAFNELNAYKPIEHTFSGVASTDLPLTESVTGITANHKLVYVEVSNPGMFVSLSATPSSGTVTLSGTAIANNTTSDVITRWQLV